jgi:hypothetical protein
MRCVAVYVAVSVVAVAACCGANGVRAGDTERAAQWLFFSGNEAWRNGAFSHGGFFYAHQGVNADGPVFKLLLNGGLYRYRSNGATFVGRHAMVAALPGWRFKRARFELTLFAGPELQNYRFYPDDPGARFAGTRGGLRGGLDIWYEPFDAAMLTGSMSLSTTDSAYWARAAAGWRFFEMFWIGPEVHAMGDAQYRQLRAGAHVTSLRFGKYEWSAGLGWVSDSDDRNGLYARIGVLVRRGSTGEDVENPRIVPQ